MKTAVILTGGTILSAEISGYYSLSAERENEIKRLISDEFDADFFSPYMLLSEQLDGEYLNKLILEVKSKLNGEYDGVMVLHGTDTLQYCASALYLAFADSPVPIVLVSSNYVLDDKRSNGIDNLHCAAKFIRLKIGGVFVSYKNAGENPSIYVGNTLLPHLPYSDFLYSTDGAFGYFEKEKFINLIGDYSPVSTEDFTLAKNCPVLWIKAAAGMVFPSAEQHKAVLIETYHSGTLPTESESFINFCKNCSKPIYITGARSGTQYSSTRSYSSLGVTPLPSVSPVFAYVSLWKEYSG